MPESSSDIEGKHGRPCEIVADARAGGGRRVKTVCPPPKISGGGEFQTNKLEVNVKIIETGISAGLDQARQHTPAKMRSFNSIVPLARATYRLGDGVPVDAIAVGAFVSLEHGHCYPLGGDKPFGGICQAFEQEARGVFVTVLIRGAMNHIVRGLTSKHRIGEVVYADRDEAGREFLNVSYQGVAIGQLYAIESLERRVGVICFRAASDEIPFPDIYPPRMAEGLTEMRR